MKTLTARQVTLALLSLYAVYAAFAYRGADSADLMAVWLAGVVYDAGQWGQVYPPAAEYFTMHPPEGWRELARERTGYLGPVYPFLYPPIWAWAASFLADLPFASVARWASVLNAGLVCAMIWLGQSACGVFRRNDAGEALLLGGAAIWAFTLTPIGLAAAVQNQPQMLVSLLLVACVERHRTGAPLAAGAALALAASIKLYPAAFALYFLARRDWRALGSFAATGAGLGLASIGVAGWPLHQAFLGAVRQVADTVLVTGATYNLDTLIAQAVFRHELIVQPAFDARPEGLRLQSWLAMPRPPLWGLLSKALFCAVLAGCAWLFARRPARAALPLLWFVGLTAPTLVTPLAWCYYYQPTVALLPALYLALEPRAGARVILLGLLALSAIVLSLLSEQGLPTTTTIPLAMGSLVLWTGLALVALLRRPVAH
ncbi:glycosyltransferase family 87 protein [Vannielia litorea]|uniref:DUF2029 domain-containing protein n=1 Tax=Vannielia litorea TaxID=1217970 RepID=A0A1N6GNY0_9RHOB|nr:glycosyltransferase family 87 protein [Vannielia litorea]SIO09218.1 Protein of unknown function [Vannielia litorea]